MSNSPLVSYTKLSPNNSGTRTHAIDRITPHCIVGQMSVEDAGTWFAQTGAQCSCNYMIGKDGRVALIVPESQRSWCSSSRENDQRAVTIECASDKTAPYAFNSVVYARLIELCTDICRRNGKKKLLWLADKEKTLAYTPAADEMILTVHRWFANKSCPGDWMYERMGDLAEKVTENLIGAGASASGNATSSPTSTPTSGTQAGSIHALESEAEKAAAMLELVHGCDQSGILNSVTTAQMILESGYCGTDLALHANNCFGMKCNLSGNTWKSVWDGKSRYTKKTAEQTKDGDVYYVTADFRKYPCVEDSIRDHAAYLLGAMNGSKKRYAGLTEANGYIEAIKIIKDGGYATDTEYVWKIACIIRRFGLDKYDKAVDARIYRVQAGAYRFKFRANAMLKKVKAIDGFSESYVKFSDGYYRVQTGVFLDKSNAVSQQNLLKLHGIDAIIKH